MMTKDVHDYEKLKSNSKSGHDDSRKDLEYFINNTKTINILKKRNIKELYPIQSQTYRPIYSGQDVIARDRTGSGKTLAFTLPVL
jgi:superfamily II DNA/RNA helicase